jgi:hypothetical protein
MIIVAGGDSMIWGSELQDSPHGGPDGYSRKTFPALLARAEQFVCAAYPGYSNYEIAQDLQTAIKAHIEIPFVIVCWTWPSRDKTHTSSRVIQEFEYYCKYLQIPYLFTCVDNCLFDVIDHAKLDMSNWYLFPPAAEEHNTCAPRGFYQWAVENKYNVGPEHHPLEDAHQDAAELIRSKFNELVAKYNQQNQIRNTLS